MLLRRNRHSEGYGKLICYFASLWHSLLTSNISIIFSNCVSLFTSYSSLLHAGVYQDVYLTIFSFKTIFLTWEFVYSLNLNFHLYFAYFLSFNFQESCGNLFFIGIPALQILNLRLNIILFLRSKTTHFVGGSTVIIN